MILVLAEKPSAAKNFAKALGGQTGHFNGSEFKIVPLRGHTRKLRDPEDQVPKERYDKIHSWKLDDLPWDISDFAWRKGILPGGKEILENLKKELEGVDEVAIATDDDPSGEGEVLGWEALEWCRWQGKTSRMYFPDEAPKSVQKAFVQRVAIESMAKDGDYAKGSLRERWDLVSMQFSRATTAITRKQGLRAVVRQGRLKSVIVALVGKQWDDIDNYVKKPMYEARFKDANGNVFSRVVSDDEISSIRFAKKEDVDLSQLRESAITQDSTERKHTAPGKLLDLAGLSAILAKEGYKPEAVLKVYQSMYEAQVVSYPRTEDKTITLEQFNELLPLAGDIAEVVGVDPELLTHRAPRKTHVKDGGAHGANRPGSVVPGSLEELDGKFGKGASRIYEILACNYLAMLCEDYEYELVKGHVTDFPEYVGETRIPMKKGFKEVFDSEAQESDDEEGTEVAKGFVDPAIPYVHEVVNKKPQKPTMKWLNKQLEKHNVGTGATRTRTVADISSPDNGRELLVERKGELSLSLCGKASWALLDGCLIADPAVTKKLFDQMKLAGEFKIDPDEVLGDIAGMVQHDIGVMLKNKPRLDKLNLTGKVVVGKCPRCGKDVYLTKKKFRCSSIKVKKDAEGNYVLVDPGCGFDCWRTVAHKLLSEKQVAMLIEKGSTGLIKGFKNKAGIEFDAKVILDPETCKTSFMFPPRKGKK